MAHALDLIASAEGVEERRAARRPAGARLRLGPRASCSRRAAARPTRSTTLLAPRQAKLVSRSGPSVAELHEQRLELQPLVGVAHQALGDAPESASSASMASAGPGRRSPARRGSAGPGSEAEAQLVGAMAPQLALVALGRAPCGPSPARRTARPAPRARPARRRGAPAAARWRRRSWPADRRPAARRWRRCRRADRARRATPGGAARAGRRWPAPGPGAGRRPARDGRLVGPLGRRRPSATSLLDDGVARRPDRGRCARIARRG